MYIQCIRKVFRPFDFFHIVWRSSLILKLIKSFFPLINLHIIPHNDKASKNRSKKCFAKKITNTNEISHLHKHSDLLHSTLLKHFWQRLQPQVLLGMSLQAWHTFIWGVSPILLCRSSQALSGWMVSVAAPLFSGLSRDVQSGSSPGSGWAIRGYSETCPEATHVLSWLCA